MPEPPGEPRKGKPRGKYDTTKKREEKQRQSLQKLCELHTESRANLRAKLDAKINAIQKGPQPNDQLEHPTTLQQVDSQPTSIDRCEDAEVDDLLKNFPQDEEFYEDTKFYSLPQDEELDSGKVSPDIELSPEHHADNLIWWPGFLNSEEDPSQTDTPTSIWPDPSPMHLNPSIGVPPPPPV